MKIIKLITLHPYFSSVANTCSGYKTSSFLLFPTWYEYLKPNSNCQPTITSLNDIWLIVAAIIDILLRVAAILAVGFIIYGGIKYTTSQGSPEQTNSAKNTILNAVIGLVIAVVASVVVSFIANSIH
jgi:ABC-type Fe3+ transport system permease subunit